MLSYIVRRLVTSLALLVVGSILQQQQGPVSSRLQDVLAAAKSDHPDEKVLNVLINALALDPSVNIRLRALEALFPHAENKIVRDGVLASLPRELDPLVQLELIDFLVAARNRDAAPELEKMSQSVCSPQLISSLMPEKSPAAFHMRQTKTQQTEHCIWEVVPLFHVMLYVHASCSTIFQRSAIVTALLAPWRLLAA